jgi:hypothetical protein
MWPLYKYGAMITMIDNDLELDFGSTLDRTIPNGTKHIDDNDDEYLFNNGYWLSTEDEEEISFTNG